MKAIRGGVVSSEVMANFRGNSFKFHGGDFIIVMKLMMHKCPFRT